MPLLLAPGPIRTWIRLKWPAGFIKPVTLSASGKPEPREYDGACNDRRGVDPRVVVALAAKVQSECRWKLLRTDNSTVLQILNLFAGSSDSEMARGAAHQVHYSNRLTTPLPSTWDHLATFILNETATNTNRMQELELAMVVAKSPLVLGTVRSTVLGIEKLMMAVRLSRGASLTTIAKKEGQIPEYDILKLQSEKSDFTAPLRVNERLKFYLPWTQQKSVDAALGDSRAGFTIQVALMHDLMEFAVLMFKSAQVLEILGLGKKAPTVHDESVTTGAGMVEPRVDAGADNSKGKSMFYAKSLHCPVECGPSYTTTRLLRLPTAISTLTNKELAVSKREFDPMKNKAGVRWRPPPPGYMYLSPEQQGHIAWAIFGWWTLNFPKHWGTGAHCLFEVADAARSCGVPIVDRPGLYPTRQELCTKLRVDWTSADTIELAKRKDLLRGGMEQPTYVP